MFPAPLFLTSPPSAQRAGYPRFLKFLFSMSAQSNFLGCHVGHFSSSCQRTSPSTAPPSSSLHSVFHLFFLPFILPSLGHCVIVFCIRIGREQNRTQGKSFPFLNVFCICAATRKRSATKAIRKRSSSYEVVSRIPKIIRRHSLEFWMHPFERKFSS